MLYHAVMTVSVWSYSSELLAFLQRKKGLKYVVQYLYNNEGTISKRSGLFQYEMKESDNLKMLFFS